ncbi:hypothetical protein FACS1894202_12800 [Clostridia bacterium]|nr:hypothetical protein FACS1894202_12800 [Clostridia bacterium]
MNDCVNFARGLISGLFGSEVSGTTTASVLDSTIVDGVQIVNSTLSSGGYPKITVQAGVPVRWTIDAPKGTINGCNNRMQIPEFGVEYKFQTGENVIEFTPTKAGKIPYSCWMGMIRSSITVVESGVETADGGVPPEYKAADDSETIDGEASPDFDIDEITEPVPANVSIPTDSVTIAKKGFEDYYGESYPIQEVTIALTESGFSPAVMIVESGTDVKWNIAVDSEQEGDYTLLVPLFGVQQELFSEDNSFYFTPTEDIDFSNGINTSYGYIKVVEDLETADIDAIKTEIAEYQTLIYPPETFQSCH